MDLIPLLQQLAPTLVFILGAPLVLLATLYVRKLLNKAGIEETAAIEALVEGVILQGVLFAEQEIGYAPDAIVKDINGSVQFKNIHFSWLISGFVIFQYVK